MPQGDAACRSRHSAQLNRPEALLWYFALSREEALIAAGNMPANTDTRILSEVRLAGMTVDPQGDEDPNKLLEKHSSLDVLPYLNPDDAARVLSGAGRYFYHHFSTKRTRRAIARLEGLDSTMAERLTEDWSTWRQSIRERAAPRSARKRNESGE